MLKRSILAALMLTALIAPAAFGEVSGEGTTVRTEASGRVIERHYDRDGKLLFTTETIAPRPQNIGTQLPAGHTRPVAQDEDLLDQADPLEESAIPADGEPVVSSGPIK